MNTHRDFDGGERKHGEGTRKRAPPEKATLQQKKTRHSAASRFDVKVFSDVQFFQTSAKLVHFLHTSASAREPPRFSRIFL